MKSVLIDGFYGAYNLGDEAILQVILARLRAKGVSDISVLSLDTKHTHLTYNVTAVSRRDIDSPVNLWRLWKAVRSSDLVITGGGGLLQDLHLPLSIPRYLKTLVIAKFLNKPVATYAVGVGPVNHPLGKYMLRKLSKNFDYFSVRDEKSKEFLEQFGISGNAVDVIPDPVWSFEDEVSLPDGQDILCEAKVATSNTLLISITTNVQQHDIEGLAQLIDITSYELGLRPIFIPLTEGDWETPVVKEVQSRLTVDFDSIEQLYSPAEMLAIIKTSRFVIASKLHAVILAAAAHKPLLILSYAPKVSSAAKLLGLPSWSVYDIDLESCLAYARKAILHQEYEVPAKKGDIAQLFDVAPKRMSWLQKFLMLSHYLTGYCWGLSLTVIKKIKRDWLNR